MTRILVYVTVVHQDRVIASYNIIGVDVLDGQVVHPAYADERSNLDYLDCICLVQDVQPVAVRKTDRLNPTAATVVPEAVLLGRMHNRHVP
jgi:hypothetical protein